MMLMDKSGFMLFQRRLRATIGLLALAPFSAIAIGPVDWIGADGNWEDGSNWSSDTAPVVTDDVTITGSVDVISSGLANEAKSLQNAAVLNITSGSLDIFSILNNEGEIATTGGRLEANSLVNEAVGDVRISGAASELSVVINLDNYGSVTVLQSATANVGNLTNFSMLAINTGASLASETLATDAGGETRINGSATEVAILGDITNRGIFSAESGAEIESESITNFGSFMVDSSFVEANSMINAAGGSVALSGSTTNFHINGNITNEGALTLQSSATANVVSIDNRNLLDISGGGVLAAESIGNQAAGDIYVHGTGSRLVLTDNLENGGSVRLGLDAMLEALSISSSGSLTVSSGSMVTTASISNTGSGTVSVDGPSTSVVLDNNFQNAGYVTISDQSVVETGSIVNTGDIEISGKAGVSTTTFINGATASTTVSGVDTSLAVAGVFENRGVLQVAGGANVTAASYGQFDGKTTLDGGTLIATGEGINIVDGELDGVGSFAGDLRLFSGADAAPGTGTSPTTNWDIDGSAVFGGRLFIDIASGALFDTLTSTGNAEVAGVLDVSLLNGYAPAIGTSFDIILAASVAGGFAQANLPVFDGRTFEVVFGADFVRLSVTAVPIPAALYLMIGPLGLACWRRRAVTQGRS